VAPRARDEKYHPTDQAGSPGRTNVLPSLIPLDSLVWVFGSLLIRLFGFYSTWGWNESKQALHVLPPVVRTHGGQNSRTAPSMVRGSQTTRRSGPIAEPVVVVWRHATRRRCHCVVVRRFRFCSLSLASSLEFDDVTMAQKIINLLTAVTKDDGEEMSYSLIHPGVYQTKKTGVKKYVPCLRGLGYKVRVAEVFIS
jgi:hypothetical protein